MVSVNLGPAQADFQTVSLPLDPPGKMFDKFSFSGAGYGVGCANDWRQRSGSSGFFRDIPTPCYIPGAGNVGAARSFYRTDGEITSSSLGVKIKRTYVSKV